jgi:hypothetical protein
MEKDHLAAEEHFNIRILDLDPAFARTERQRILKLLAEEEKKQRDGVTSSTIA